MCRTTHARAQNQHDGLIHWLINRGATATLTTLMNSTNKKQTNQITDRQTCSMFERKKKNRESNFFPQPMIMVHHQLKWNHQCANIIKYIWLLIQVHTLSHSRSLTYTGAARLWFTFFFNCSRCFDIFFCVSLPLSHSPVTIQFVISSRL